MTTPDVISADLKTILRRLKLSRMLDTLPERLTLARQQKVPHQDLLLQVLSDEVAGRESLAVTLRVQKARLDPTMRLESWDATAKVTLDRALLNELATLRFLDAHAHVPIVGPVGVGKAFLAHALGHIACRRGASVLAVRTDQMLKTLKHARLDNNYEAELRKLVAIDFLILDDFAIDIIDAVESRDLYGSAPGALSHRIDRRDLESRARRMARHLCRRRAGAECHRSPSPAMPTISSSTASPIAHDSKLGSPRMGRSARDDAPGRPPRTRGRSAAANGHHRCHSRPPPSACRLSVDQSGGESVGRIASVRHPDGVRTALKRADKSGGKVLKI